MQRNTIIIKRLVFFYCQNSKNIIFRRGNPSHQVAENFQEKEGAENFECKHSRPRTM